MVDFYSRHFFYFLMEMNKNVIIESISEEKFRHYFYSITLNFFFYDST